MPKKLGENTKAVAARARKQAAKDEANLKKQQQAEDEYWKDEDKHIQRKQQRKENKEKKASETAARKAANKALAEEELNSIKPAKPAPVAKVTRAQIERLQEQKASVESAPKQVENYLDEELEENVNLIQSEGTDARNVDEAIAALSVSSNTPIEKHPEKRMKAAYAAFEEKNLPILKKENPNMRLSQLKQLLKKEWLKSPDNPMNQQFMSYNQKR